jgi:hypothetical protein
LGTLLLDTCLKEQRKRAPHGDLTGVAKRFQKRLAAVIAAPWHMAIGQELGWSGGAGGKQPGIMNRLLRQYVAFVLAALPHNRTIAEAFCHVQTTGKSPLSLLYPPIVWQVLRAQVRAKPSVTAGIVATLEASTAAFRR